MFDKDCFLSGPVDGINPELSNLTCSLTLVEPGDIVFLTSDGISDNFDPVVGKFCVPKREKPQAPSVAAAAPTSSNGPAAGSTAPQATGGQQHRQSNKPKSQSGGTPSSASLPEVEAYQRHELTLLRMEDLLNHGSGSSAALPGKGFFLREFSRKNTW